MQLALVAALALHALAPSEADGATLTFAFSPTLTSGSDPHGLGNAVWTFSFEVTQPTYQLSGAFSDVSFIADSAELIISGATNGGLNGTHGISSTGTGGDFVFIPNLFGSTFLALQLPTNTVSSFSFGGVSVTDFGPSASPAIISPNVGDPVNVAVFNNADYSSTSMRIDGSQFSFDTSVPVPEPATSVLWLFGTLGLLLYRGRCPYQP